MAAAVSSNNTAPAAKNTLPPSSFSKSAGSASNNNNNNNGKVFGKQAPEFVAVVLAATTGTRLFPITSSSSSSSSSSSDCIANDVAGNSSGDSDQDLKQQQQQYLPKHLLHVAGYPVIYRLLNCLHVSGFTETVIAIAPKDDTTIDTLKQMLQQNQKPEEQEVDVLIGNGDGDSKLCMVLWWDPSVLSPPSTANKKTISSTVKTKMKITVVRLQQQPQQLAEETMNECPGSVEALRQVENAEVIDCNSHIVVVPGDLVVFETPKAISKLVDLHRQRQLQSNTMTSSSSSSSPPAAAACTMLLSDVGEIDEQTGHPLKESTKQKKGGLARDEGEIEYIALSYPSNSDVDDTTIGHGRDLAAPRVVWKQSKLDVEIDEDMVGSTPKLMLPKLRLRGCSPAGSTTQVRTSYQDLHAYCLSPWVRRLVVWRKSLVSLQSDVVPLLISRQFRGGVLQTFGSRLLKRRQQRTDDNDDNNIDGKENNDKRQELLDDLMQLESFAAASSTTGLLGTSDYPSANELRDDRSFDGDEDHRMCAVEANALSPPNADATGTSAGPIAAACASSKIAACSVNKKATANGALEQHYEVVAHVVNKSVALRTHSIAPYLYASKELVARSIQAKTAEASDATAVIDTSLALPPDTLVHGKFHSIQLPGAIVAGDAKKMNVKSSVIGRRCQLGIKCRLNNTVVQDDCTVGDNTILQNCCLGRGCSIGANCNLNDCQVAPGKVVPPGTKEKGEALLVDGLE